MQLDKLHNHIKDQLPRTNTGLIDAYKEIIPAICLLYTSDAADE